MSYDLAVWEGRHPADDDDAGSTYVELSERYLESAEPEAVAPRIAAYVAALVARYPDDERAAVWASAPVIGDASGPIVPLYLTFDGAEEVAEFAASLADEHGLVCYDPQADSLRP